MRQSDTGFFGVNPLAAEALAPRQRILLDIVYEALESAGWPLEGVAGSAIYVFVGLVMSEWNDMQVRDLETAPTCAATGTARSIMSIRISFFSPRPLRHNRYRVLELSCRSV